MKDFVNTYAKAWEHQHVVMGQVSVMQCEDGDAYT